MKLSALGALLCRESGISTLMDDLGAALSENPDVLFMGGGNPGRVPEAEQAFSAHLEALLASPSLRYPLLGVYQSPQGERGFRADLAAYLSRRCGWPLTADNIAIANGSQSAFFLLANILAGPMEDGTEGTIHLPLCPEYVGYRDVGLTPGRFTAAVPRIEELPGQLFKYHVDTAQRLPDTTRALCVSRPSNPTGNVVGDTELASLDGLARQAGVPFIVDGAYGSPFPNLIYTEAAPHWNDNTILLLSLSKLGLPAARTGIVVAREDVARAFARANTVMSLACGNLGPMLLRPMLNDGSLDTLCAQSLRPFYEARQGVALDALRDGLGDLPVRIHRPEGAFFLWLWCAGLAVDSRTLYQRLKARGVVVCPGEEFFIGAPADWHHQRECLRLSYAGDPATIRRGCELLAEELHRCYGAAAKG